MKLKKNLLEQGDKMRALSLLFLFLLFTSLLVISNNDIHIFSEGEAKNFFGLYFDWMALSYSNAVFFTANAVKMDWVPENVTNKIEEKVKE